MSDEHGQRNVKNAFDNILRHFETTPQPKDNSSARSSPQKSESDTGLFSSRHVATASSVGESFPDDHSNSDTSIDVGSTPQRDFSGMFRQKIDSLNNGNSNNNDGDDDNNDITTTTNNNQSESMSMDEDPALKSDSNGGHRSGMCIVSRVHVCFMLIGCKCLTTLWVTYFRNNPRFALHRL